MTLPKTMRALVLEEQGRPLVQREMPVPNPRPDQVLIKVNACGVCRTDLHIIDGDLEEPKLPLIPGHEIVGEVVSLGEAVPGPTEGGLTKGDRIGVPWLGWTDGTCPYCRTGRENLCDNPRFTGYTTDGGYTEYAVADYRYCFPIPNRYSDVEAAPLLCAGLIGYRSLRLAGKGERLGLYGFGAAAHILAQVAQYQNRRIFAFTRPGDQEGQRFALGLGCEWAGGSDEKPPVLLDAAIVLAPVGALIPAALEASAKGATIVSGGIHMSEIPSFPYRILWEERVVRSVANLTRSDGHEFMKIAPDVPVATTVQSYPLAEANRALEDLRSGRVEGAAVLVTG